MTEVSRSSVFCKKKLSSLFLFALFIFFFVHAKKISQLIAMRKRREKFSAKAKIWKEINKREKL